MLPSPVLDACSRPAYIKLGCRHGLAHHRQVGCGSCPACREKWRRAIRRKIREGAQARQGLRFVTFTLRGDGQAGVALSPRETALRLAALRRAWRSLRRNVLWRRFPGEYFRVVHVSPLGRPHIHLVTTCQIPLCQPISACSGLSQWERTLSPAASSFYRSLRTIGFGLYHSALVRVRASAGSYLGRYLGNTAAYVDSDGVRLRVAEGSRGWSSRPLSWFAWSAGPYVHSAMETSPPRCGCTPSPMASPSEASACRRRNLDHWKGVITSRPFGWYHVQGFLEARRKYRNWVSRERPSPQARDLGSAHYKMLWKRLSRWFHGSAAAMEAAFNAYRATPLPVQ